MIKRIKSINLKTEFNKNILTLTIGSTLAQIFPIAISPILTRLYSPSDFGLLAIFVSITAIFGTIINGRYELAVILPDKESDAINILALGVFISSMFSILLLIFVIIFHNSILLWIGNENISLWLYIAPIVVFFLGLYNMLNYYSTRKKYYKNIANSNIIKATSTSIIQIALSILKDGSIGLIGGYSIGQLFGNIRLLKNVTSESEINQINKKSMLVQARRYIRFPKYTLPASFANILSSELTNILVSKIFSISTLGFYSLANRVLNAPSSFVGQSISQVYYQEATDEKKKYGNARKTFRSMFIKLSIFGLPFFTLIFFISEWLFSFIFGTSWAYAGKIAQILTPLLLVRFIVSPLSISLSIFEKQHLSLLWQSGLLIISLLIIFGSVWFQLNFIVFLYIFVFVLLLYYLLLLLILYRVIK